MNVQTPALGPASVRGSARRRPTAARRRAAAALSALLGAAALSWPALAAAPLPAETASVGRLDPARAQDWIWITDFVGGFGAGRNMLFDTGSGQMLGMLNTGAVPAALQVSTARSEIYVVETHFARGSRGQRTDVLAVYDASDLAFKHEIELPPKTYAGAVRAARSALLDGDRFLVSYNFNGGQSVSVTDVASRRFVGEFETAGCAFAYPLSETRFFMLCGDGALLDVQLGADGRFVRAVRPAGPTGFGEDLVFDHAERIGGEWVFLTLRGRLLRIGLDRGSRLRVREIATLADPPDRSGGALHPPPGAGRDVPRWQITGLQPFAVSAGGELFVLAHDGPRKSYQDGASQVEVFDLKTGRRLRKLTLAAPASSIAVIGGARPTLAAAFAGAMTLELYDVGTGRRLKTITEAAISPLYLQAGQ